MNLNVSQALVEIPKTSVDEFTKTNRSKLQPYYEKPGFVLYHANCLDILLRLPENSVDLVFADPPYRLSNDGFTVHSGNGLV